MTVAKKEWGRRFAGKTAIVTGAGSGIGQATVWRLAAEGAHVLALDLSEAGLAETLAKSAGLEGKVETAIVDVASEEAVEKTVSGFVESAGKLDVLVNMAGIMRAAHVTDMNLQDFMRCVEVNLGSVFLMCKAALPHLEAVRGNIVNAASTSSFHGCPYLTSYASSKGAVASFTYSLAWEYMKRGVRVNGVAPGSIQTGMSTQTQQEMPQNADWSLYDHILPPNDYGGPDAVASVIAMLASDDGYHMTGEIVRMDGGMHA